MLWEEETMLGFRTWNSLVGTSQEAITITDFDIVETQRSRDVLSTI